MSDKFPVATGFAGVLRGLGILLALGAAYLAYEIFNNSEAWGVSPYAHFSDKLLVALPIVGGLLAAAAFAFLMAEFLLMMIAIEENTRKGS
jgi:hypothetical protein